MRIRAVLCIVIGAAALVGAGCGGSNDNSDQEAISAVLNELRTLQDSGDGAKACNDVYVIQEAQQRAGEIAGEADSAEPEGEGEEGAGGESPGGCEQAFEAANEQRQAEVKDLTTAIGSIEVDGDRATAIVHTQLQRADGSNLTQDVPYDLVRTPDGWRVRIADEG